MSRKLSFKLPLLCALALAPLAHSQNVFVLPPADGTLRPVTPFRGDPFQAGSGPIAAASDTFMVLSTPNGSKFYFIGRSATDTVVITDQNFNVTSRKSLGSGASAAAISPDGRYFFVVAGGAVQVFSTTSDQLVTQLAAGSNPNDVAVSRDGQRLFVTSSNGQLTSFDLNSFGVINSLQNLGPTFGVSVGPNGFVYVSATNALYEIDPRDLSFRGGAAISLNAQPGKPIFMADANGNTRVVMTNSNPGFGGSSLITVDLGTRTFTPLLAGGVVFDKIVPVSSNRLFATTVGGTLYDVTLPSSSTQASFSGVGTLTNVRSIAASNEFPNARFLYAALTGTNQLVRIDLASNSVSGTQTLTNPPGPVVYAGAAATGSPSTLILFNNGQFVNPSSQTLPLVVRVVDSQGRPLAGVPVQFTATTAGTFISSQTTTTDPDGYAQAVAISPALNGPFQVTVTAGGNLSSVFNLNVGTGTTGATGAISVRSGNGQVIRESNVTPDFLRVVVKDSNGNPVPNAVVNWTVTTTNGPNGSLNLTQSVTDFNGEATNTYVAPFLGPNLLSSYIQSTITASTFSGSVNLYVTVIPNVFGSNPASLPTVQLLQPNNTDTITGQAGTTVPAALQVRVTAGAGPGAGTAIPNVGLSASTGSDPTQAPTARCADNTGLTDSNGLATCDLVIGPKIGTNQLTISAGGQQVTTLNLTVTPGVPGKIIVAQGDNQSGPPNTQLPLALLATVQDNFGNLLPGANVTWSIDSGSATLVNSINRADNLGRVSTLVKTGNTAGPSKIRVTAANGLTTATATFTVTTNITATSIQRVSGDGQSAIVNTAFSSPLVASVLDSNGNGVGGLQVNFAVTSGSAVLSTLSPTSDSSGRVSVNVTAGSNPGPVTVTANFSGNSVSWNLTVQPLGPAFSAGTITNIAGGATGIAPGSLVTIRGTNLVPSVRGTVIPAMPVGPMPTNLGGVTVAFGGTNAAIFAVSNDTNGEAVTVQVPFEVQENQSVPVTVSSGGTSSTVNVQVSRFSPGIFETTDSLGRRYAVVVRPDGSFVTPDNPIGRGETAKVYMTGLGRTSPAAFSNTPGAGQPVASPVVVGINDAGVRVISATLAPNLIGVYEVTFEVPTDAATGSTRNFGVGIDSGGGNLVFANASTIAIK